MGLGHRDTIVLASILAFAAHPTGPYRTYLQKHLVIFFVGFNVDGNCEFSYFSNFTDILDFHLDIFETLPAYEGFPDRPGPWASQALFASLGLLGGVLGGTKSAASIRDTTRRAFRGAR